MSAFHIFRELNARLVFVAAISSIGSMGFGFDNNWWGGALGLSEFKETFGKLNPITGNYYLPSSYTSAGTGLGSAGIIIGCLIAPYCARVFGRKRSFLAVASLLSVGTIIQATTVRSFWQLTVGKVVTCAGIGLASNIVPLYLAECSPASIRGTIGNCYSFFNAGGAFISAVTIFLSDKYLTSSKWSYLTVVVCQIFVPVAIAASYPFLPESPRYLVFRGRLEEAKAVIRDLYGNNYDADSEVYFLQMQLEEQRAHHKATSFVDCFRGSNLHRTSTAMGVQILQQAQGVSFVNNYVVVFMQQLGFKNALSSNVIVIGCGWAANVFCFYMFTRIGRRPILFAGALAMAIMMFVIGGLASKGAEHLTSSAKNAAVAMLILWQVSMHASWSPGIWIITGEIGTAQLRERTVLLASLGSFVTSVPINFVNPFVQAAIGGSVTFIYGGFSVLACVFVYYVVPETRNRSLEALDEIFQAGVSARKFSTYECRGLVAESAKLENGNVDFDEKHDEDLVENWDSKV
ncbi:general substrate transporter [Lipomyces doorenjongii]